MVVVFVVVVLAVAFMVVVFVVVVFVVVVFILVVLAVAFVVVLAAVVVFAFLAGPAKACTRRLSTGAIRTAGRGATTGFTGTTRCASRCAATEARCAASAGPMTGLGVVVLLLWCTTGPI